MKIKFRGETFHVTSAEADSLKAQLTPKRPDGPWFVGLSTHGNVVAEGTIAAVAPLKNAREGVNIQLTSDGANDGDGWWYFGCDHYTIVTEEQYDALVTAGLARPRDE